MTMQITLHSSRALACSFPYSAAAVARIKSLPYRQWDKLIKTWLVPVSDLQLVLNLFPDASVDPSAWEAAYPSTTKQDDQALEWCYRLMLSGVYFILDTTGRVRCCHDWAPAKDVAALQRTVDEYAPAIKRLFAAGHQLDVKLPNLPQPGDPDTGPAPVIKEKRKAKSIEAEPGTGPQSREATPLERAFFDGIQNAKLLAERDEKLKQQRSKRWSQVKLTQQQMFGDNGVNDD